MSHLLAAAMIAALAVPAPAQLQFAELGSPGLLATQQTTSDIVLGDVDGDGDLDLIDGGGWQSRLFLNDGAGTFTDVTATHMPAITQFTTVSLALGDVDGDGDLDLVLGNFGVPHLFLNNGMGIFAFAPATNLPVPASLMASVVLGDVDGDGDLDLVFGGPNVLMLYLNDGTGAFTDATSTGLPGLIDGTSSLALGDIDGDGDLDLVVGNTGQSTLFLNSGSGIFTDATAARMPVGLYYTWALALGDVDDDGDLDMVLGNGAPPAQQSLLYINDGTGTFTDATATRMPLGLYNTRAVALGDLDDDGDLDMVLGNGVSPAHQSSLYLNDGAGTFSDVTATRMPLGIYDTVSLALGDVDGDGDLDMVLGNSIPQPSRLYLNLLHQLDAPLVPIVGHTYTLDAYSRYAGQSVVDLAAIWLSTAPASIPWQPFGTVGIDLAHAAPLPALILAQPAGVGTASVFVPNLASLIGQPVYSQAMLVGYPNDLHLSNVVRDVIE